MKKKLQKLSILVFIVLSSVGVIQASHLSGGELTWKCVLEGGVLKYKFKAIVYDDCRSIVDPGATSINCYNLNGTLSAAKNGTRIADGTTIKLTLVSKISIMPDCSFGGGPLVCDPNNQVAPDPTDPTEPYSDINTVAKYVFESDPIDFYEIAPPTDANSPFVFVWSSNARDDNVVNIDQPGSKNILLRAKMFPYKAPGSTVPQPVDQCYDNAPDFSEAPSALLYVSSQDYFFNNNAIDQDLDDLSYDYACPTWDPTLNGECSPEELTWVNPSFSTTNPLGLPSRYFRLNTLTGEYSFKPLYQGKFVSCFKVTSKKCDQVVSEVYRDFMAIILPPNSNQNNNKFPSVIKMFDNHTKNDMAVLAGTTLRFPILIRDSLPNSSGLSPHSLTFTLNGVAMGAGNADTQLGCPYPPCAVVSKANNFDFTANPGNKSVLITNSAGESFGFGYKNLPAGYGSNVGDTLWFYWPTTCANLDRNNACSGLPSAVYNFVVTAQDNFCSVPGKTIRTFSITVLPPDFYKSPPIRCINYDGGQVHMQWGESTGDTLTFKQYDIYRGNTVIATIMDRTVFSYTDPNPGVSPWDSSYYVRAVNFCGAIDEVYPAKPIRLTASFIRSNKANLSWNAIRSPKLSTSSKYYVVFRSKLAPLNWEVVTDGDGDSTNTFAIDNYDLCGDTTLYKVHIYDNLGCYSVSNVDTVKHQKITATIKADTVCFGDPTTIIIDSIAGGIGPYTYALKGPEGFPGPGISNYDTISYIFKSSGKKGITFVITDSKGCKFEVVDTAYVMQVPKVEIWKDSSCAGGWVTFGFNYLSDAELPVWSSPSPIDTLWKIEAGGGNYYYQPTSSTYGFGGSGTLPGKYPVTLTLYTYEFGKLCIHNFYDTLVFGESKVEILENSNDCYDPETDTLHLKVDFMKPQPDHNTTWTLVSEPGSPIIKQVYAPSMTGDTLALRRLAGYSDVTIGVSIDDPNSCVANTQKTIKLAPYFTLDMDSVCVGDPARITIILPKGADSSRYRYDWTFGTEVVSGVREPNQIYLTEGAKYFTVTVTDTVNGCSKTKMDTFVVKQPIDFDIDVTLACAGEPTLFSFTINGAGVDGAWRWYIADAFGAYRDTSYVRNPSFLFPPGKGVYNVTLSIRDQNTGCWTTVTEQMKVFNQPDIDFYVDENNCTGNVTRFISKVVGTSDPYTYRWNFGDGSPEVTDPNPSHIYPLGTEFYEVTLIVTNRDGCSVPLEKMIKVCDDQQTVIKVPEVFIPEENNTLKVYYSNVDDFEMIIYNRWGVEVFRTNDQSKQWDGKDKSGNIVPSGSYVYIVQGNGPKRKNLLEKGTITIVN